MPTLIHRTTTSNTEAAGTKQKTIDEFVGRVNSKTDALSVAHMKSPRRISLSRVRHPNLTNTRLR